MDKAAASAMGWAAIMKVGEEILSALMKKAGTAAGERIEKELKSFGGKHDPVDEQWYQWNRWKLVELNPNDTEMLSDWDHICRTALSSFGEGPISRMGYINASTAIRVNLAALAQAEMPTIKVETHDPKTGKVTNTVTKPDPDFRPLSVWFMQHCVSEFRSEKTAQVASGKSEKKAEEIALGKVHITMRDSGFPVGRVASTYQSADNFLTFVPDTAKAGKDKVKKLFESIKGTRGPLMESLRRFNTIVADKAPKALSYTKDRGSAGLAAVNNQLNKYDENPGQNLFERFLFRIFS